MRKGLGEFVVFLLIVSDEGIVFFGVVFKFIWFVFRFI